MRKIVTIIILVLFANYLHADMVSTIQKMYDKMGLKAPTTLSGGQAASFEAQGRNYLTGGSLILNSPIEDINIIDFQPPKIKAGCGGIDFYLGSFSYINLDKLNQLLRAIAQNAVGYAFKLALSTLCPTCDKLLTDLKNMIDKINALLSNTCDAAKFLVNSTLTATGVANEQGCIKSLDILGSVSDRYKAKEDCTYLEESSWDQLFGTFKKANKTDDEKQADKQLIIGNLVWEAFKKIDSFTGYDGTDLDNLKYYFMSLTGTIINKQDVTTKTPVIEYKEPTTQIDEIIDKILIKSDLKEICNSSTNTNVSVKGFRCQDTNTCLELLVDNITVPITACNIYKNLRSAINKTYSSNSSGKYSDEEKFWVSLMIPSIYSALVDARSHLKSVDAVDKIIDIEAKRIAIESFNKIINSLKEAYLKGLNHPAQKQFPEGQVEIISDNIDKIKEIFREKTSSFDINGLKLFQYIKEVREVLKDIVRDNSKPLKINEKK